MRIWTGLGFDFVFSMPCDHGCEIEPDSPRDICGGHSSNGIGFSLRTSGFPSPCHFSTAPHSKTTLNRLTKGRSPGAPPPPKKVMLFGKSGQNQERKVLKGTPQVIYVAGRTLRRVTEAQLH